MLQKELPFFQFEQCGERDWKKIKVAEQGPLLVSYEPSATHTRPVSPGWQYLVCQDRC